MSKRKSPLKKVFNLFTGVIVGGAIGSILGLTLAPKKGSETRKYLKNRTQDIENYLNTNKTDSKGKKIGPIKRFLIKKLTPKNKSH